MTTDGSTSSTANMSSTDDSMSSSMQSFEPAAGEVFDPDQPFIYPGFYDQNGVFFVNREFYYISNSTNKFLII